MSIFFPELPDVYIIFVRPALPNVIYLLCPALPGVKFFFRGGFIQRCQMSNYFCSSSVASRHIVAARAGHWFFSQFLLDWFFAAKKYVIPVYINFLTERK